MGYEELFVFAGGLGMFIYGMQIMSHGLENAAGNRMKSLLEVLTKNKLLGVALGALITAVIQSSSATTVMLVGFVNSGIMSLGQTMSTIMGANVGTTVTSWLLSLSGISGDSFFIKILKPTSFILPSLSVFAIVTDSASSEIILTSVPTFLTSTVFVNLDLPRIPPVISYTALLAASNALSAFILNFS